MQKLYIKTFGCQMNEYDSARMAEVLGASHGFVRVEAPEDADVLLLNTCSIREKAEDKVYTQLGFWRPLKQARPELIIGVGGCVASQEGEALRRRAPFVDVVFGPQTLHRLPDMIDAVRASRRPQVDVSFPEIEKFDNLPAPRAEGPSAFVTIMEGCDKYCTFCVVPFTRGREVSRPFDDVVAEVEGLAAQGVREVTLLGQNVNAYRGEMDDGTESDLALLLHRLALVPGIARLRYTTSHPNEFGDSLIAAHRDIPQLVPHLHLPVQSGSDYILKLMHRKHTAAEYLDKVRRLQAARPGISISSDFIIGFPGESDADFEATMALIEAVQFDQSFSFKFSPRPGTPAAELPDDVPEHVKDARLARLQARINELAAARSRALVGTVQDVLVTGASRRSARQLTGKTACNRSVNFDAPERLIGQMVKVEITEALSNSLRGRVVLVDDDLDPAALRRRA
ncbi:MAG: tRNA (N6-isopentenyl adenosine(37)-C2)-methylthiotransferase MiaB [Pseudomonadota bacterium]|uniref:tRNA (N6-isopentenyl adenosine(37)-C2)-methylthiotransferase MiaB n=1 Tax=Thermithiobacillus tepidarius TaxID=929 RepID=UPI00056EC02F|nr:tRNA (N6-isopentenyl adenosine(37)-C2)-methylthiotransferase MiaB [Thermithiobacillus tepidarius]